MLMKELLDKIVQVKYSRLTPKLNNFTRCNVKKYRGLENDIIGFSSVFTKLELIWEFSVLTLM